MSMIERRLQRVADRMRISECRCNGHGTGIVVRYVGPGDPLYTPTEAGERRQLCKQHPPRLRFGHYAQAVGAYVEVDPMSQGRSGSRAAHCLGYLAAHDSQSCAMQTCASVRSSFP